MKKLVLAFAGVLTALVVVYGAGTTINGTRVINGDLTVKGTCIGCGGGGALVLVEQHTASSSASLDFTTCISSTYDNYQFEFINDIPDTNSVGFLFLVSTDGGSTYQASSYGWNIFYNGNAGTDNGGQGSTSDSSIRISNSLISSTTSNGGVSGELKLYNPLSTSYAKIYVSHIEGFHNSGAPSFYNVTGAGAWNATTAVNAVQFKFSSGNIASGTIRCYGIAKS